MAQKILVADKLAEEGLEFLKGSGMQFDVKVGLKEDELAADSYSAISGQLVFSFCTSALLLAGRALVGVAT